MLLACGVSSDRTVLVAVLLALGLSSSAVSYFMLLSSGVDSH